MKTLLYKQNHNTMTTQGDFGEFQMPGPPPIKSEYLGEDPGIRSFTKLPGDFNVVILSRN